MNHSPLESRIAALRRRVRGLVVVHGLSRIVAGLLPMVLLACLADWAVHLDPLVRLALLAAMIAWTAWAGWRWLLRPLLVRFEDLDVARRIEARWPGLNDRLISTVQFLKLPADDASHGSPALREATAREAMREIESIDFREVIEPRPVLRAGSVAGLVLLAVASSAALAPASSRIALRRLFAPFGGDRWPQLTHLVLDEEATTLKLARGDSFSLLVRVRPGDRIPESAKATYRFADGEVVVEPLGATDAGEFRGRIEAVNQPFAFSVTGGDDAHSIQDVAVRVVAPPALSRTTIRLVSPAYTGLPPQTLAQGLTSFRALRGTRIEIDAEADKPLSAAELHLGDAAEPTPIALASGDSRFQATLEVSGDLDFWFSIRDAEGFPNRRAARYDVRMLPDQAPRVTIVEPRADRDVPADAHVPIQIEVDDDFGIHSARLLYTIASGGSEPHEAVAIPLWSAPDAAEAAAAVGPGSAGTAVASTASLVRHQELRHDWDLASLGLVPGSVVAFYADARDFDAIQGPNIGKSREIRLRIISKEEAARQFDESRRELREEIARALAMQNQAIRPVEEAARALAETDHLSKTQREDLGNAGIVQRQVGGRLNNRDDGLEPKTRRLLEDLDNFKLDNAPAREQLEELLAQLDQIRRNNIDPAEQALSRANKSLDQTADAANDAAENAPGDPNAQPRDAGLTESAKESLAQAKTNQQAIADELQKMLDGLGEFETYRGVVKDAEDLLKKQEEALKQSADAAADPELAGKLADALPADRKGDLDNLASRQRELSKGLTDLRERMNEMAGRLDQSDPLAAAALREAAEASAQKGTSAKMEEAAQRLAQNQMGEARDRQETAREELRDLVDLVKNRRERELARLVKEMKKAESDLRRLRARQAENLKATREAQKNPNADQRREQLQKLAKEQAQIREELKRQLQKLSKLGADAAGRLGEQSAGKMSKAEEGLDQDDADEAGGQQEEALADLNDAQDELEQARREAEERLADEQLARMGDQLKSLAERQGKVVVDAEEYDKQLRDSGELSRARRVGVRSLGQVQTGLKDEAGDLASRLDGAPVIALSLRRAVDDMDASARGLAEIRVDEPTLKAARSADHRLKQLIDALKPDDGQNGGQAGGGGGGGGGGGAGGNGDGIPPAAQVKLLKALQEEINDRTDALDEIRRRKKELTPDQVKEAERLADDQGTLADLVRDLARPKRDDGEE